MRKIFLLILIIITSLNIYAQDILVFNNGKELRVTIHEVLNRTIKYRRYKILDSPVFTVSKRKISKIVYENGKTEFYIILNPREHKPDGISLFFSSYFNDGTTGLNYDAFITPKINANIYFIIYSPFGVGGGINYHPLGDLEYIQWSPYIGLNHEIYLKRDRGKTKFITWYIPVGINYTGYKWFSVSFDLGFSYVKKQLIEDYDGIHNPGEIYYYNKFMTSLKIGYRF